MRFTITLITALACGVAADSATVQKRDCPVLVDTALAASVSAMKLALAAMAPANLQQATDAGAACFKQQIGCATAPPPAMREDQMNLIDCSGLVNTALTSAVSALKLGLGPLAPANYQAGVDAGLACFKKTLGCTTPPAK